jgi:hypothetical protein
MPTDAIHPVYLHVRAGVTAFDDILVSVFDESLADVLPTRVLPISTEPPVGLELLIDRQFTQIGELLQPRRRRRSEARGLIRTLLVLRSCGRRRDRERARREPRGTNGRSGTGTGCTSDADQTWRSWPSIKGCGQLERAAALGQDRGHDTATAGAHLRRCPGDRPRPVGSSTSPTATTSWPPSTSDLRPAAPRSAPSACSGAEGVPGAMTCADADLQSLPAGRSIEWGGL